MVMLRSSSFLNLTVWTPEIAFTTVDLPWATCPIVPILIVAWRLITSGDKAVNLEISYLENKDALNDAICGICERLCFAAMHEVLSPHT